ncbi:sensor histidine kinase [Actinomadura hibisca]|uniref:sensor histidine kinase n=1 Tax=Actinomadura hibisca TaxID=68565 RepID=UPI00082CFE64|nr:HAMP domain-containing sensor histidine kinase [Actinomadura hibisca]
MRGSLARVATAVTAMVALSFIIPLGLLNGQMARDRALGAADRQAASLIPVLTVTREPATLRDALGSTSAGENGRLALHLPDGTVLGTSHATPDALATARRQNRTFPAPARGGTALLAPVLLDGGRLVVIEAFVPEAELSRGVAKSWLILTVVALALALVAVAMADRLATRVVRSADQLAGAVTRVAGGDLTARVRPHGPAELRAAGEAFNHMADQLARLLVAERETVADLSHRLRTPLTALRVNLDGLAGHPGDPGRIAQSRDALTRLEEAVNGIIATARHPSTMTSPLTTPATPNASAPPAARPPGQTCDAAALARDRMEFWSALAEDQDRAWQLTLPEGPAPVPVAEAELGAVLDALLGNTFRHTPPGTALSLTVHRGRYSTGLLFGDAGPGIPDPEAALRRGASSAGSTGLGLDIARRLAESTGGSLQIGTSPLGGAQIGVWLRTTPVPQPRRR